ncbi:hypothetical protein K470DRAFT_271749 [Piedraia hortae CBS 480.64]|uniref:Uncharacterized protein n=1 Tax=Piedraia hortae CBS 480.64 TaxID=1314780 RepID=A0A6A7BW22_9PEZI|nr:hypothetical protein K470DRAFT_271749 [Piedraia hortae CBS 480.64]
MMINCLPIRVSRPNPEKVLRAHAKTAFRTVKRKLSNDSLRNLGEKLRRRSRASSRTSSQSSNLDSVESPSRNQKSSRQDSGWTQKREVKPKGVNPAYLKKNKTIPPLTPVVYDPKVEEMMMPEATVVGHWKRPRGTCGDDLRAVQKMARERRWKDEAVFEEDDAIRQPRKIKPPHGEILW